MRPVRRLPIRTRRPIRGSGSGLSGRAVEPGESTRWRRAARFRLAQGERFEVLGRHARTDCLPGSQRRNDRRGSDFLDGIVTDGWPDQAEVFEGGLCGTSGDRQDANPAAGRYGPVSKLGFTHLSQEDANLGDLVFGAVNDQLSSCGVGFHGRSRRSRWALGVGCIAEHLLDRNGGQLRVDSLEIDDLDAADFRLHLLDRGLDCGLIGRTSEGNQTAGFGID